MGYLVIPSRAVCLRKCCPIGAVTLQVTLDGPRAAYSSRSARPPSPARSPRLGMVGMIRGVRAETEDHGKRSGVLVGFGVVWLACYAVCVTVRVWLVCYGRL